MSLDDVFLGYSTLAQLTPEQRNSALADLGSMRPPLMIINRYTPLGSWQTWSNTRSCGRALESISHLSQKLLLRTGSYSVGMIRP